MDERLKPCPFCGSEAEMVRNSSGSYFARCTDRQCAAKTRLYHENENGARIAWNRRTERTCCPINVDREDKDGRLHRMFHRCSECGLELPYEAEKGHCRYCPHCGARVVCR